MAWLRFFAIAAVIVLAGCATTRAPQAYLAPPEGPYRLDSGDGVRVTVYGDEKLTEVYRVDDAGFLSLPLVGPVPVRDRTTREAASEVARMLANGFMRNPDVAVEVAEYRPFFIQGQIGASGQYPYVPGMSVRAAISTAGGFTETARREHALVYRRQGEEMLKGKVSMDFLIFPGDTIIIEERWF